MNRQIWTNQESHLSTTNAEEQASALCTLCGKVENTMHRVFECARCSEPLWELVGEAITALMRPPPTDQTYQFMHIVQYIIFMMVKFHDSMTARLWHGSKKLKGI